MLVTLVLPEEVLKVTLETYNDRIENEVNFDFAKKLLLAKKKFKRAWKNATGEKGWIVEFKDEKWLRKNVRRLKEWRV